MTSTARDNGEAFMMEEEDSNNKKRPCEEHEKEEPHKRPRRNVNKEASINNDHEEEANAECEAPLVQSSGEIEKPGKRWRTHQMAEDYVQLVGNLMYPGLSLSRPYGYGNGQYPVERVTTLGYLCSPLRRPTVMEKWSPYEIALFEASLSVHGKVFHKVRKAIATNKTTKDVVEFYYIWKKTSHYKAWKEQYAESDLDDDSSDDDDEEHKKEKKRGSSVVVTPRRRSNNNK